MPIIKKFIKFFLAAGALSSLSLLAVPFDAGTKFDKRKNIEIKVQELRRDVQEIRGLKFHQKIKISYKKRSEMLSYLMDMMDRQQFPWKQDGERKALIEFGFLEEGTSLKKSLANFYATQALGLYDLEHSTLILISDVLSDEERLGKSELLEANKTIYENLGIELIDFALLHELDHALIDQNFHLKELKKSLEGDFDKILSYFSLIEGEAILATYIFAFRPLGVEKEVISKKISVDVIDQQSFMGLMKSLSDYPSYITCLSLFPYQNGLNFVSEIYMKEGWKGVNALYLSPPLSTEQILHPEKYTGKGDPPQKVLLQDIGTHLSDQWRPIDQNTLGEFRIRFLISHILGKDDTALIASEGWGGDRYLLYENTQGEHLLYFKSLWDSERDALEFYQAYLRSLQKLSFILERSHEKDEKRKNDKWLRKGSKEIFLSLNGKSVKMMKGPIAQIKKLQKALNQNHG